MRPSAVGGARRCPNALSLCGLSLHAGSPPLLCGTAWHSAFPLHVEFKHALRAGAHGMATLWARKEWATTIAADSGARYDCLGRDEASVREEEVPSLFDLLNHRNR